LGDIHGRSDETHAFASFEWMLSLRYLRARRREGSSRHRRILVLGIMLAWRPHHREAVMNGSARSCSTRFSPQRPSPDPAARHAAHGLEPVDARIAKSRAETGRRSWMASPRRLAIQRGRLLVRGIRSARPRCAAVDRQSHQQGLARWFRRRQGVMIGAGSPIQLSLRTGDSITAGRAQRRADADGRDARTGLQIAAVFRDRDVGIRRGLRVMPLIEAQAYSTRSDVTAIEVYTDRPTRIDRYRKLVAERPAAIFMIDWRQRNATFFTRSRSSAT